MKIKIDRELCLGCGTCVAIDPDIFELDSEGKAYVKSIFIPEEKQQNVIEAINSCPASAISEIQEIDDREIIEDNPDPLSEPI